MFSFPWVFSPAAYFAGAGYKHNVRKFGGLTEEDSARITNWQNHCYRGLRPSQGYLREIYPVNLISPLVLKNSIDGRPLDEWISDSKEHGKLSEFGAKWLWEIPYRDLPAVQKELDRERILLSGFAPDFNAERTR